MLRVYVRYSVISVFIALLCVSSARPQTVPAENVAPGTFAANVAPGTGVFVFSDQVRIKPGGQLIATGDSLVVGTGISVQRIAGFSSGANMTLTGARAGTNGSPVASGVDDEIGRFVFRGYDGAAPVASARVGSMVDAAVAPGVVPQAIVFKTGDTASPPERLRITSSGVVYVGGGVLTTPPPNLRLHVTGNAHVNGTLTGTNVRATYQDIAEWVTSEADLEPGTVVTLHPTRVNTVVECSSAYDTAVAGVVSAQPGISLGIEEPGMEQIATTGRVRVRVDATRLPIRIGDLLVTSDTPGTAMRSVPQVIGGRSFHQPGTVIGKALEPLEAGVGSILVLLSLQ